MTSTDIWEPVQEPRVSTKMGIKSSSRTYRSCVGDPFESGGDGLVII